jgi:hypothetical protein
MKFSDKFSTVEEIESWYEDQVLALLAFKNEQIQHARLGTIPSILKFHGLSIDELLDYFDQSMLELEYLVCFNLLAVVEAHIRMDFYSKIKKRPRLNITKRYQELFKEKKNKVSLEEDLLEILKDEIPSYKSAFSAYDGALKFRHWIAHGRYWVPKLGMSYTVGSILPIAYNTMEGLEQIS